MQLVLKSAALAAVVFSALTSAVHPNHGSSGESHRLIRKRIHAGDLAPRGPIASPDNPESQLAKRAFSGQATFYDPSTGPGNCGKTFQKSDPIVAVNTAQFEMSLCYSWITVSANGKTAQAQITDSCPSCAYGALDFSPDVFDQFATPDQGVFQMTWWFGSGSGSGSSSSSAHQTKTSSKQHTTHTTHTTTHSTSTSTYTPPSTHSSTHKKTSTSSSSTSTRTIQSTSSASSTTTAQSTTPTSADNNLGLLGQAVGGFAKMAQMVNTNTNTS